MSVCVLTCTCHLFICVKKVRCFCSWQKKKKIFIRTLLVSFRIWKWVFTWNLKIECSITFPFSQYLFIFSLNPHSNGISVSITKKLTIMFRSQLRLAVDSCSSGKDHGETMYEAVEKKRLVQICWIWISRKNRMDFATQKGNGKMCAQSSCFNETFVFRVRWRRFFWNLTSRWMKLSFLHTLTSFSLGDHNYCLHLTSVQLVLASNIKIKICISQDCFVVLSCASWSCDRRENGGDILAANFAFLLFPPGRSKCANR